MFCTLRCTSGSNIHRLQKPFAISACSPPSLSSSPQLSFAHPHKFYLHSRYSLLLCLRRGFLEYLASARIAPNLTNCVTTTAPSYCSSRMSRADPVTLKTKPFLWKPRSWQNRRLPQRLVTLSMQSRENQLRLHPTSLCCRHTMALLASASLRASGVSGYMR